MAPFFQKKLRCFYCGLRSSQSQKGLIRQWECKECDAVNYLDENGEITDPPTFETSSETRFAQPLLPHQASDPHPDTTLFCQTCIKNQQILTDALAQYLPPPSDPDYAAYESSYPTYRKNLEERYPQVCVNCEARVRDRIRQSGYEAKADHLRRMMEQSRRGKLKARGWNWRSSLVSMGAIGYWGSIFGQLGWNIVGAMTLRNSIWDIEEELPAAAVKSCVDQALALRRFDDYCSVALTPYAGLALILGVLSLWWNPRLRDRVEKKGGRLAGLDEYYKIQIFVIVVRFVAWACLQDPSMTGLDPGVIPAVHMFTAAFTAISVIMSRRVVQFNTVPLVSWHEVQEPLIPQRPNTSQDVGRQLQSPPDSQSTPIPQRFPINSLAPQPTPSQGPFNPPTPPPEIIDDSDAMDWTPSQFSLQPNHSITRLTREQPVPGPSPFHGQLPAAPNPPAWQIRRTQNGQTPQPPTETPKPNPFNRGPVGFTPQGAPHGEPASDTPFAPPKFFPPKDFNTDTGLESLFDKAFTIADQPADVQNTRWQLMANAGNHPSFTHTPDIKSHSLKFCLLSCSSLAWYFTEQRAVNNKHVEIMSLAVACLVAGFSLLETLKKPVALRRVSDIIISLVELVASAYLGGSIPRGSSRRLFAKAGECLLSFMAAQEMMALIWPRYSTPELSPEKLAPNADESFPRPNSRDTNEGASSFNTPLSEGRTSTFTPTPVQNVQHSPSPSASFSVASSSHASSITSPFPSRDAAPDIVTPLRSQRFAPPATTRPNYSPMPSFVNFSLSENDSQSSAAGAAGQPYRRYPVRARRG
ncbi:hypothetical protein FQN54_009525 [Arachnomyces sp. PD_36]|nr:hypothetical protein FQN54_009525 [Arachnomyces sp. PD_36]